MEFNFYRVGFPCHNIPNSILQHLSVLQKANCHFFPLSPANDNRVVTRGGSRISQRGANLLFGTNDTENEGTPPGQDASKILLCRSATGHRLQCIQKNVTRGMPRLGLNMSTSKQFSFPTSISRGGGGASFTQSPSLQFIEVWRKKQ